jgi:hypothetical protein
MGVGVVNKIILTGKHEDKKGIGEAFASFMSSSFHVFLFKMQRRSQTAVTTEAA